MNGKQIAEEIEKSEYSYFGLRSMTPNYYGGNDVVATVGMVMPESYIWDNNESTGELLNGTCAIDITGCEDEEISKVIDSLGRNYDGKQIVLLGSHRREHGDDDGEIIMCDAVVISVWSK